MERLARDILTDPVRVVQGDIGEVNESFSLFNILCFSVEIYLKSQFCW